MPATVPTLDLPTSSSGGAPLSFLARFGDALQLLCCGHRPSDELVVAWLTDSDDHRLQDFAAVHGPSWAQGLGLIDAAEVAASQPEEGVEHEMKEDWLAAREAKAAPLP